MKCLLVLMCFMVLACVPIKVIPAKDLCIKYGFAWPVETKIEPTYACVCTADLYEGLEATVKSFEATPTEITLIGAMTEKECNKPEPVNDGDESLRNFLKQ